MIRPTASRKLVESFAIFTFDLNLGHKCEYVYPANSFPLSELEAIAMLSFPDSQSANSNNCDCVYTFNYRLNTQPVTELTLPIKSKQKQCDKFVQCYVYFRQFEDQTNTRGYYQKSFVIISSYSEKFNNADDMLRLVRSVGNKYYIAEEVGCGREVLVDAFDHIEEFGYTRRRAESDLSGKPSPISTSKSLDLSPPSSPSRSTNTFDTLYSLFEGMWHLWEAVIVGLPILLYAPGDPDICSRCVIAVSNLAAPVEYQGDVRPFLSIFDADYTSFKSNEPGPCIVGITSPMALTQLASRFSVVIIISGTPSDSEQDWKSFIRVATSPSGSMYISESISSVSSGTRTHVSSLASMFSATDSGYRLALASDALNLSKKIVTGLNGGDSSVSNRVNRKMIQRHFSLLTRDFLIPFIEYTTTDSSLLPSNLFGDTPFVKPFKASTFINSLMIGIGRGLSQLSREKLRSLYTGFLKTISFRVWLRNSQAKANKESIHLHAELISRSVTSDKVIWMSTVEREKGIETINRLIKFLEPGNAELIDCLSSTLLLLE
jgi:hypothetical protein